MNLSQLKNQWLPICHEKKISHRPQRFIVLNTPIVVFRLNDQIIALQDRCPHRGAPLSVGKIDGELLQCSYHGWRFNASGECVAIPGLTKTINCTDKSVPAYAIQTHLNLVFVCLDKNEHTAPLYSIPALQTKQYCSHFMQFKLKGDILNIIENVLDATHTHFVHGGLLRHDKKRQYITAKLSVNETNAEIRYENEKKQSGLVSSLFEKERNFSIGRFHFPLIAELEYHAQHYLTASFTFFLSPTTSTNEHNIFLLISYRKNWLTNWIKKLFLLPFIKLALKQDKDILGKQDMNIAYFPGLHFKSTELDILRPHIERILNNESIAYQKTFKLNV